MLILERFEAGAWMQVSSEIATIEIAAMPDEERRMRVQMLLPGVEDTLKLTRSEWERGADLEKLGFKPADAVHVAAAERTRADVLLSCDDQLCRLAKRRSQELQVNVANPLAWLKEIGDVPNA